MNRGIAFIEVVAATALMTLIVLACVPLLRAARTDLSAARAIADQPRADELRRALDDLLRQRPNLARHLLDHPEGLREQWTTDGVSCVADLRPETPIAADAEERRSSHLWAVALVEGLEIPLWLRVPNASPPREPTP